MIYLYFIVDAGNAMSPLYPSIKIYAQHMLTVTEPHKLYSELYIIRDTRHAMKEPSMNDALIIASLNTSTMCHLVS